MTREEATRILQTYLKDYADLVLQKSKEKGKYNCPVPFCNSGRGKNGTGALGITEKEGKPIWHCFSCGTSGDILDLYGIINNTEDFNQKLEGLCQMYGINIDGQEYQNQDKTKQYTHTHTHTHIEEPEEDYRAFFLKAHEDIGKTDYWQKRGLSKETVDRFNLGFVSEWKHPKQANNPNVPLSPRLIIPTSPNSYLARDTRAELTDAQRKYDKQKVGKIRTFNREALKSEGRVFIAEAELDALSIIEAGAQAVGLGSAGRVREFLRELEKEKPTATLIISLDNDKAGMDAYGTLSEGLKRLKIEHFPFNISGEYKDQNEALQRDREGFIKRVKEALEYEPVAEKLEEENQKENYINSYCSASFLQDFINGIADNANTPAIPTGYKKLDEALDGGLFSGLYTIGAISSLGKTTFVLQLADQLAKSGQDVLIFSLEMARHELIAKSISRLSQLEANKRGQAGYGKTTRGILDGNRWTAYTQEETDIIYKAIDEYSEIAKHVYIYEGLEDETTATTEKIKEKVQEHINNMGTRPVVIVDYLQIISPLDVRASDKQNTDKAVTELKRLSRKHNLPVIAISSLNRSNYNEKISMVAFKESGSIEYSSDVLIGLQLEGVSGENDIDEMLKKNPRKVELVILKNRNGQTGEIIGYNYYPRTNIFQET